MATPRVAYDLALFLQLNEEYREKPIHPNPPPIRDAAKRLETKQRTARNIAKDLSRFVDIRRKVVLDFGCGRGDLDVVLAEHLDCSVTGVDVQQYTEWADLGHPKVRRLVVDLSAEHATEPFARQFDVIVSNSVLEHVKHPYRALESMKTVLKPGGIAWLKANLYRGPLASHRYREVYFPWPHLLFTDEVFRQFYEHMGRKPTTASWVNKLTHLHYHDYFQRIGFDVLAETFSKKPFDEAFYQRFEDILGRYPRSDLERDFINVVICPRS